MTYFTLLGECSLPEVSPAKYKTLIPSPLKSEKGPGFGSLVWRMIKGSLICLFGIISFAFCLMLIFNRTQLFIGIAGLLLFGLGTLLYFINFREEVKESFAYLKSMKKDDRE